jgi:hypothetical protein
MGRIHIDLFETEAILKIAGHGKSHHTLLGIDRYPNLPGLELPLHKVLGQWVSIAQKGIRSMTK